LRANSQELEKISISKLAELQQTEHLAELAYPQKRRAGLVLSGSLQEKAARLLMIIREKCLL
jgi:hypothetical protein